MHCDFACLLYSMIPEDQKLTEDRIHDIITSAVEAEHEFVSDSLPVDLIGMNAGMMRDYICYVADRMLLNLGYSKIYSKENPFSWMELLSVRISLHDVRVIVSWRPLFRDVLIFLTCNPPLSLIITCVSFVTQLNGKTNFFEKRVGEYAKAGVGGNVEDNLFSLDADF
jgi:ribonucleoside-diphosphate reductase beta chain